MPGTVMGAGDKLTVRCVCSHEGHILIWRERVSKKLHMNKSMLACAGLYEDLRRGYGRK